MGVTMLSSCRHVPIHKFDKLVFFCLYKSMFHWCTHIPFKPLYVLLFHFVKLWRPAMMRRPFFTWMLFWNVTSLYIALVVEEHILSSTLTLTYYDVITNTWQQSSSSWNRSQNCNSEIDRWKKQCSFSGSFIW